MKHVIFAAAPAVLQDTKGAFIGVDFKSATLTRNVQGDILSSTPNPEEFHSIVDDNFDHTGAIYCAQWNGKSPTVKLLVGNTNSLKHAFLGWPMVAA